MHQKENIMLNRSLPKLTYTLFKGKKKTQGSEVTDRIISELSTNFQSLDKTKLITSRRNKHYEGQDPRKKRQKSQNSNSNRALQQRLSHNHKLLNSNISAFQTMHKNSSIHKEKSQKIMEKLTRCKKKYTKQQKQEWLIKNSQIDHQLYPRQAYHFSRYRFFNYKKSNEMLKTCMIQIEPSTCHIGCFPLARNHPTLVYAGSDEKKGMAFYLLGGLASEIGHTLHFHKFQTLTRTWIPLKISNRNAPRFNISQHCAVAVQNKLYLIGGIAIYPSIQDRNKNQRYNVPFISVYNLETEQWKRINWNAHLRAHACCRIKRYIIINGGINQYQKYQDKTYLMNCDLQLSPVEIQDSNLNLSFHKIVSTDQVQEPIRKNMLREGLYCFGGKLQDNKINHELYFCEVDSIYEERQNKMGLKWRVVEIEGAKPCGRYGHSMNILNIKGFNQEQKALIMIIGGKTENQQILNDIWGFDLIEHRWHRIEIPQNCKIISKYFSDNLRGITNHGATCTKNSLYIFGGMNQLFESVTDFWSVNFCKKTRRGQLIIKKLSRPPNMKFDGSSEESDDNFQ